MTFNFDKAFHKLSNSILKDCPCRKCDEPKYSVDNPYYQSTKCEECKVYKDWRNIMTEIKLKPCPFCGSKAFLSDNSSCSYVCCGGCGATGQSFKISKKYSSDEKAIEAWNRRVSNSI